MEKTEITALVKRAQARDSEAFASLYSEYYRALYKTAFYILGNEQDAEDTVMETVTDVYTGIGKLRAPEAFEGWLFKILYNKARRKRGTLAFRATLALEEQLEAPGRDAGQIGVSVDLMRALATLSRTERAILVLAICEGRSSAEIGGILGLNPNTVRSKQMRALAKLRAILEKE